MSNSIEQTNKGIIVTGGTISSENLAVGDEASISNSYSYLLDNESAIKELRNAINLLIHDMEKSKVEKEKIDATKAVKKELESESPNLFFVKSILLPVIEGIKSIGSASNSVVSIQKLLGVLLP